MVFIKDPTCLGRPITPPSPFQSPKPSSITKPPWIFSTSSRAAPAVSSSSSSSRAASSRASSRVAVSYSVALSLTEVNLGSTISGLTSGGGNMGDKLNSMAGGGEQGEKNEDYLDKGA